MKRTHMVDALVRVAQPLNVLALPVLIRQGRNVRAHIPRLPEARGPTTDTAPGPAPPLHLTVLGDSAAAAVPWDLVVDPNLGAERSGRDVPPGHRPALARGSRYALVRHSVAALRGAATVADEATRVLVVLGGSDVLGLTSRVIGALA